MIEKSRIEEARKELKFKFPNEDEETIEKMLNICISLANAGMIDKENFKIKY